MEYMPRIVDDEAADKLSRADVVLRLLSGRWAATEVKLGGDSRVDEGVRHLLALAEKIDAKSTGEPAFLTVAMGTLCLHQARRARRDFLATGFIGALCLNEDLRSRSTSRAESFLMDLVWTRLAETRNRPREYHAGGFLFGDLCA